MQKATIVVLDAVGFSHSAIAQWIGRDARLLNTGSIIGISMARSGMKRELGGRA